MTILRSGELIDDNGFTIVDRSRVPSFEEKDTHEPVRKGKVEVDDAGFVITDLNAPTPPPDPVEDENGFVVQYANGDEQDTPSTQRHRTYSRNTARLSRHQHRLRRRNSLMYRFLTPKMLL